MPIDEHLLERIDTILRRRKVQWTGRKMFGGYCYMVDDKMCLGYYQGGLMARVGPDALPELVKRDGQNCPDEFLAGRTFAFTAALNVGASASGGSA